VIMQNLSLSQLDMFFDLLPLSSNSSQRDREIVACVFFLVQHKAYLPASDEVYARLCAVLFEDNHPLRALIKKSNLGQLVWQSSQFKGKHCQFYQVLVDISVLCDKSDFSKGLFKFYIEGCAVQDGDREFLESFSFDLAALVRIFEDHLMVGGAQNFSAKEEFLFRALQAKNLTTPEIEYLVRKKHRVKDGYEILLRRITDSPDCSFRSLFDEAELLSDYVETRRWSIDNEFGRGRSGSFCGEVGQFPDYMKAKEGWSMGSDVDWSVKNGFKWIDYGRLCGEAGQDDSSDFFRELGLSDFGSCDSEADVQELKDGRKSSRYSWAAMFRSAKIADVGYEDNASNGGVISYVRSALCCGGV
jgi:hypothetical protein